MLLGELPRPSCAISLAILRNFFENPKKHMYGLRCEHFRAKRSVISALEISKGVFRKSHKKRWLQHNFDEILCAKSVSNSCEKTVKTVKKLYMKELSYFVSKNRVRLVMIFPRGAAPPGLKFGVLLPTAYAVGRSLASRFAGLVDLIVARGRVSVGVGMSPHGVGGSAVLSGLDRDCALYPALCCAAYRAYLILCLRHVGVVTRAHVSKDARRGAPGGVRIPP